MEKQREIPVQEQEPTNEKVGFDYSYVSSKARIAVYDDLKSAPRITEINPSATNEFIESLTSSTYALSQAKGGTIPYTVIREVAENFIHAQFKEIVVSILDSGNTIRFADQGPGIPNKSQAQRPGFSSATEPMKSYIRGVGSGLPIVKDYLSVTHGSITIEDNLIGGSVITISNIQNRVFDNTLEASEKPDQTTFENYEKVSTKQSLTDREKNLLKTLLKEGALGVTRLHELTGIPLSSIHTSLVKMEHLGLMEKGAGQKRALTKAGYNLATQLD